MLCEKCHEKEAMVHTTHKFPLIAGQREPATLFRQHFCKDCAAAFERDFEEFVTSQPQRVREGMSKEERWEANQPLREELQRFVTEWATKGERP